MTQHPCPGPSRLHPDPDKPPLIDQPLCGGCCSKTIAALRDLPELYTHLWLALTPSQQAAAGGRVSGSKERPLPLQTAPRDLMDRSLEVVASWAETVQVDQQLADPTPRATRHGRLDGWTIATSSRTLTRHFQPWIHLAPQPMLRRVTTRELRALVGDQLDDVEGRTMAGGAWLTLDLAGWQGALEVLELKHQARRLLGLVRGKDRLPEPCPNPECEQMTLVRWHGADQVECEACGEVWPDRDYERLVKVLASYRQATKGRRA